MRLSTAALLTVGGGWILFETIVSLNERFTYPYRFDDVGMPWAFLIVQIACVFIAAGLVKWWFVDRRTLRKP
jgi:hypothetical protein